MGNDVMCVDPDTAPPPPVATVGVYGQCGGKNYDGHTQCGAHLVCEVVNEYYSHCKQPAGLDGVPLWGQCGGQGYEGATNCLAGASCVELNQWYSQCKP